MAARKGKRPQPNTQKSSHNGSARPTQARKAVGAPQPGTARQSVMHRIISRSTAGQSHDGGRRTARARRQAARMRRQWLTIGAVVLGVVAIGAYLLWPRPQPLPVSAARLAADPAIGPATAPVTIVEYGDFGCPSCKAWHDAGILKQVLAKYGDKIHFVWRDFPIITPQSPKAAEAGQCAFDQGKFWPYHDLLYARQPAIGVDDLKAYARELGLNTAKFNQCLDSGQYTEKVNHSLQEAENLGFQGTPGFQVNGKPFAGPPSFDELSSLIDAALAAK